MVGVLLLLALVYAHVRVHARGFRYSGPLLVLDHLYVILIVVLLLGLCAAVGSWTVRRWSFGLDQPLERLSFGVALGAGAIATGILIWGSLALLDATMPFLIGCGILARRELLALPFLVRDCARQLLSQAHPAALLVFAVTILAMLVLAVAPPADYDSLMYHVEIPSQFLRAGRIYLLADNPHTAQVALPHMLYLPLVVLAGQSAPAVFSTAIAGLLGLGVFGYCSRFLTRTVGSMVLVVLWGSPILVLIGVTARIDVTFGWLLFLATYALAVAARDRRAGAMLLSGLLFGMAVGTKYFALPFILAVSPVIIWTASRCTGGVPASVARMALAFGAVTVLGALPWLAKNAFLFDAPLYPLLTEQRMDPWLSELYGGRSLPIGLDETALNPLSEVRAPFNLRDLLLAPDRLTPEGEGTHYVLNPIAMLAPAVLFLPNARTLALLLFPGLLYPMLLLVPYPYTNLRYLIPSILFLTIAGTAVVVHSLERLSPRARRVGFLAVGLLCLTPATLTLVDRLYLTDAVSHALGWKSRRDYLFFTRDYTMIQHYKMAERVNGLVPSSGRVLLLFEGRGLYVGPQALQDNLLRNWVFLVPWLEGGNCLEGTGITHVLVAEELIDHYARRGMDLGKLRWNEFDRFSRRCLVPLEPQPDGYGLYRIRAPRER